MILRLCLLALCQGLAAAAEDRRWHWRTEPDIPGQLVDVKQITNDVSKLAPGYLFFAPVTWAKGWGPKIYQTDGLLLWDGQYHMDGLAQQFHVCDYKGTKGEHLCWHEASSLGANRKNMNESSHDYQRVFSNGYEQIGQNYTAVGEILSPVMPNGFAGEIELQHAQPDSHEFHIVDNGRSYVQTVYWRKEMDLTPWTGPKDGMVLESCFQDIELETEKLLFEWCYLDHLPLETHIYVKSDKQTNFTTNLGGDGSWFNAWDYFHINSVDRNDESDYLISGRHNDQVIKIAGLHSPNGKPGEVLWRLGGDSNEFEIEGDWIFTRQHDVRYVLTHEEWTWFTMFDNAWEGEAPAHTASQPYSSGKLIAINNKTMTARLMQEYPHPEGRLSRSGGSVQLLPNKNVFIGWGFIREITEYSYSGEVLFHAHLINRDGTEVNNYRNYKYPWVGLPAHPPKIIAYSQYCSDDDEDTPFPSSAGSTRKRNSVGKTKGEKEREGEGSLRSPLHLYISWNGATEITSYRISISDFASGPYILAGTFPKRNFETAIRVADRFYAHVRVEVLGAEEKVLWKGVVETFVPDRRALKGCDENGCSDEKFSSYEEHFSSAGKCQRKRSQNVGIVFVALAVVLIELLSWAYSGLICAGRSGRIGSPMMSHVRLGSYVGGRRGDDEALLGEYITEQDGSFRLEKGVP